MSQRWGGLAIQVDRGSAVEAEHLGRLTRHFVLELSIGTTARTGGSGRGSPGTPPRRSGR